MRRGAFASWRRVAQARVSLGSECLTDISTSLPTLQRRRELDAELERSQADRKTLLARLQVLRQALPLDQMALCSHRSFSAPASGPACSLRPFLSNRAPSLPQKHITEASP